jgi:tetratricopeptide (TPR) repeat protein
VGRVLERAGSLERAEACYRRAAESGAVETRAEALYRLGLRARRERRFDQAAVWWRELLALTDTPWRRRDRVLGGLRQFAIEALAIHHEHRARDFQTARELTLFALEGDSQSAQRAAGMRYRLARRAPMVAVTKNAQLFQS